MVTISIPMLTPFSVSITALFHNALKSSDVPRRSTFLADAMEPISSSAMMKLSVDALRRLSVMGRRKESMTSRWLEAKMSAREEMYLNGSKSQTLINICADSTSKRRRGFARETNVKSRPLFAENAPHLASNSELLCVLIDALGAWA